MSDKLLTSPSEVWYSSLSENDYITVFQGQLIDALTIGRRDCVDIQWVFDAQNETENVADDEEQQDQEDFATEALDTDNDIFTHPSTYSTTTPTPTTTPVLASTLKKCRYGNVCYGRKSGKCPFNHADY